MKPFTASLMIQGAANFVPHVKGNRLLVLVPRQDTDEARRFRGPDQRKIPPHESFLHVLASNLDPALPPIWTTWDLTGYWVLPKPRGNVPPLKLEGASTAGLPSVAEALEDVDLEAHAPLNPRVLPGGAEVAARLKTGIYLDKGVFGMDHRWAARVRFGNPGSRPDSPKLVASNTHKLELGAVDEFSLVLRPFAGGGDVEIRLHPVQNRLDVWIRHICEIRPPKPPERLPGPTGDQGDSDFALNYILRDDATALAGAFETVPPPVPYLLDSWVSDDIIGPGWPLCFPALEGSTDFTAP